jgi:hypothetical protein
MESKTENFVPSVVAYHRAMATFRHNDALIHARAAVESAPCDSEAAHWATVVSHLEQKTDTALGKIMRVFGLKGSH